MNSYTEKHAEQAQSRLSHCQIGIRALRVAIIGGTLGAALALYHPPSHAGEFYVGASAGLTHMSGPGTETHKAEDCNPHNLPDSVADKTADLRLALGYNTGHLGFEIGFGKLGNYLRSLDFGGTPYPNDDFVGERENVREADARVLWRFNPTGRFTPYVGAELAAVMYKREVWTGHTQLPDGSVQYNWDLNAPQAEQAAAGQALWKKTSGVEIEPGVVLGAEYKLSDHVSVIGEASVLFGAFRTQTLSAGVRFTF